MIEAITFCKKVKIAISDLSDGNMRAFEKSDQAEVVGNQLKLGNSLGLDSDRVMRLKTIYDGRTEYTDYAEITPDNVANFNVQKTESEIPTTDGLVTKVKNLGLLLPLADCLAMVVYDEKNGLLGLLHGGHHNVEQDGPRKFIEYLKTRFGSKVENLKVYYSPCAQNYPVHKLNNEKLPVAATRQLLEAGVSLDNIAESGIDTVTDERFPSHSNGDTTKRFAIIACMK